MRKFLMNFKNSIDESPQLQLDFLICKFLHKTPAEVRELEQKIFIQAGIIWEKEHFSHCPFLG